MDVLVMDHFEAENYMPEEPTYAIRILNSDLRLNEFYGPLKKSKLFVRVREYVFDDIVFDFQEGVRINREIASRMLRDFNQDREKCKALLVHCSRGRNRSPAVAIAFNDIFHLGKNSDDLRRMYPEFTQPVYDALMKTARLDRLLD